MNPTKKTCKSSKFWLLHQLIIIHIVLSSILHFTITWQNYFYNIIKGIRHFLCVIFALALKPLYPLLFQQNKKNPK